MWKPSLKATVEIKIDSVICPNVQLDSSQWVHLRICLLGFHLRTRLIKAQFPLKIAEVFRVQRTFPLCSAPMHLYSTLAGEHLLVQLVQLNETETKVLALFQTDLNDVLFTSPYIIREKVTKESLSLVLKTTHDFPVKYRSFIRRRIHANRWRMGIGANPHLEATVKVRLMKVHDAVNEVAKDGGENLTLGIKAFEHFDYDIQPRELPLHPDHHHWLNDDRPVRLCQKLAIANTEAPPQVKKSQPKRNIFVVRRVDEKLIGRTPSSSEPDIPSIINRSNTNARCLKSPWYLRNMFHQDTVSSLLRRKPSVNHRPIPMTCLGSRSSNESWPHLEHSTKYKPRDAMANVDSPRSDVYDNMEEQESFCRKPPAHHITHHGDCWTNHYSETCTVCHLYQQYFGEFYPLHLI